jgi:hypothetical protein
MKERDIYRRVYQRLWRHPNFRALTEGEKVLALYLVTGPQTNLIGWYRFSPAMAAEDIDVPSSGSSMSRPNCSGFAVGIGGIRPMGSTP